MNKALEIAARLKNKYYCVNTIQGLQSDIENVVEILRSQDDDINRLRALNAELVDALKNVVSVLQKDGNGQICLSDLEFVECEILALLDKAKEQS